MNGSAAGLSGRSWQGIVITMRDSPNALTLLCRCVSCTPSLLPTRHHAPVQYISQFGCVLVCPFRGDNNPCRPFPIYLVCCNSENIRCIVGMCRWCRANDVRGDQVLSTYSRNSCSGCHLFCPARMIPSNLYL